MTAGGVGAAATADGTGKRGGTSLGRGASPLEDSGGVGSEVAVGGGSEGSRRPGFQSAAAPCARRRWSAVSVRSNVDAAGRERVQESSGTPLYVEKCEGWDGDHFPEPRYKKWCYRQMERDDETGERCRACEPHGADHPVAMFAAAQWRGRPANGCLRRISRWRRIGTAFVPEPSLPCPRTA